jgi:hypothetical protein
MLWTMSVDKRPPRSYLVEAVTAAAALCGLAYLGVERVGLGPVLLGLAVVAVVLMGAFHLKKR